MVVVVLVYQLEVLDAGLVDSAIEVEHECLHLCFSKNMSEKGQNFYLHSFHLGGLLKKNMIRSVLLILNCSCIAWFFCTKLKKLKT